MRLVLGNPGRFFEDAAPIFRAGAEDEVDFALFHNGISGTSHARVGEQIVNIFQPAAGLVEKIFRNSVAMKATRDPHIMPIDTQLARTIGKGQRNFGKSERFTRISAIEDDVGHLLTAE